MEWRAIKSHPNYAVSDNGLVKSIKNEKPISPDYVKKGYFRTRLQEGGRRSAIFTHRLVAEAFIPNLEDKPFVNHKNGIKTDNRVENLEWVTSQENLMHAREKGLLPYIKIDMEQAHRIREMYATDYYSQKHLGDLFSVSRSTIRDIVCNYSHKELAGSHRV